MSKILDPDHDQGFEGPKLGSNCSQRLWVQDKSGHWKVKSLTKYQTHLFFQTLEGFRVPWIPQYYKNTILCKHSDRMSNYLDKRAVKPFLLDTLLIRENKKRSAFLSPLHTSKHFSCHCGMLATFANNLDPDQARQYVGPDLDLNCLSLRNQFFFKVYFEKRPQPTTKTHELFPSNGSIQRVKQLVT